MSTVPPRNHPPNRSIGSYLVIRSNLPAPAREVTAETDLALVTISLWLARCSRAPSRFVNGLSLSTHRCRANPFCVAPRRVGAAADAASPRHDASDGTPVTDARVRRGICAGCSTEDLDRADQRVRFHQVHLNVTNPVASDTFYTRRLH
jgi:hypothetical protein